MSIRSLPALCGVTRRSAADHDLCCLFAEIRSARAADRQARGQRRTNPPSHRDATRLESCLVAYTTALERYRLPVPPAIRDELRLRSGLPS